MRDIIKSASAKADLIDIADYYEQRSGMALAERFLANAKAAFELLSRSPGIGAPRQYAQEGLRMWCVPKFETQLIFYTHTDSELRILRILHGARDLPAVLSELEE